MIRQIRAVAYSLPLLILAASCSTPPPPSDIEFRVPVFVREVATGDVEDRVVATGTLRATETIALRADTAGTLAIGQDASGRRLAEGSRVEAGQIIAEITGDEVRLAARSDATRQRLDAAQRDYDSKKQLFDDGLISELELRPTETALAEARLEADRSLLTETRSRLITPIAGVILKLARDEQNLPLANGQLITQGYMVAQVAPTGELIADVDLVGPDVARAREGLRARVRHHAWEDQAFQGRVIRLAPTLDPMTRTLRAEVAIDNSKRLLRPGMFVEVTMIVERHSEVPVVPRGAVAERGGKKVVFVLDGQRVAQRDVVLGLGDDDIVEIKQGLDVGERIVVRGIETLTDGAKVRVSGA